MESKKIRLKIATPEKVIHETNVDSISCMTELGEVTILPGHIPLVANIKPGELRTVNDSEIKNIFIAGGFLEVRPDSEVIILADAAEHETEIDIQRAEEARERARKAMAEKIMGEEEYAATAAALERSTQRLRLAKKRKYKDVGKER